MGDHMPERPSWKCAACGQPWPCRDAKAHFSKQYANDRVGLSFYMGMVWQFADQEIGATLSPEDLYDRFVTWTRP